MTMKVNLLASGDAFEQAETALCIWEYVIETRCKMGGYLKEDQAYEWFSQKEGAVAARCAVINFAPFADAVYTEANKEDALDGHAFDWEIIPNMIEICVGEFENPNFLGSAEILPIAKLLLKALNK